MKNIFTNILYCIPFIFFIIGYSALSWLTHVNTVIVPQLVGMSLADSITQLSALQLNVRVVGSQEEIDVPAGTVMSHMPVAGSAIKTHQRVVMVISKKPEMLKAPVCTGMSCDQIESIMHNSGIRLKKFYITSTVYPKNMVIAQSPSEGQPLPDKTIIVYYSQGEDSMVIVPDFQGLPVSMVESFCARNELPFEILYGRQHDSACGHDECVVSNQRPLAGSLVDIHKGIKIQISVERV